MLAVNVTRGLNAVPGVYAPSLGDATALAGRAQQRGVDQARALLERFDANFLLVGRLEATADGFTLTLQTAASDFEEDAPFTVSASSYPELAAEALEAVVTRLRRNVDASALAEARAVASDWPAADHIGPVGRSAARLASESLEVLTAAQQERPDVAVARAERARAASLAGEHELAVVEATEAAALLPRDPTLWTLKAAVETRAGDPDAARDSLAVAVTLNPSYGEALQALAALVPVAEAVQFSRLAVNVNPRLLDAQLVIANAETGARSLSRLRQIGDYVPEALFVHERVVEVALESGDAAGAVDYVRQTARDPLAISPALFDTLLGVPDDAIGLALPLAEQAVAVFPDSADVMLVAARLLRRAGEAETAVRVIEDRFGDRLTQAPQLANELALTLLSLGRDAEARDLLSLAAADSLDVRYNLALAYLESGRPRAAADAIRDDIEPNLEDASVWSLYAAARLRSGNLDEAEASAQRALRLEPDNVTAQEVVASVEEARAAGFTRPTNLEPDVRSVLELGLTRLEQGRYAEAVEQLRTAYEASGGDAFVAYHLGSALQRAGFPTDAVRFYEEALPASGGSPQVRNNLGFAWLQSGRFDRALEVFKALVEDAPDFARAHLNLALTYRALSLTEQAEASLATALELDPSLDASNPAASGSLPGPQATPDPSSGGDAAGNGSLDASGDGTLLQVGAFADRTSAQGAIDRLAQLGFNVQEIQEDGLLKIAVGPFSDANVGDARERLAEAGFESFAR
jgi:tetratricopeptide (TPR) repeat protein